MASERREKQKRFEEKKQKDRDENIDELKWNSEREIIIQTWGNRLRKSHPQESQRNFNVCGVSYKKRTSEIDLRSMTGMDKVLKDKISTAPRFDMYIASIVRIVENENMNSISVNCSKGRHRSVSVANYLKDKFWPKAKVYHIELGKFYNGE